MTNNLSQKEISSKTATQVTEKKYNLKIDECKVICLDCDKEIKGFMHASGNKTAVSECSNCGKIVKIPVETFKKIIRSHEK